MQKNAWKYFTWAVISFTISVLFFAARGSFVSKGNKYLIMLYNLSLEIMFGSLCVLSIAKDLGKKKSHILATVVTVCSIIIAILVPKKYFLIPLTLTYVCLSLSLFIMIYFKYKDKAERGTK